MSRTVCFALDLVDDAVLIAEYEKAHLPGAVWPEVISGIRAKGFLSLDIWRVADRLMMVAQVAEDWPRALDAGQQAMDARWEEAMNRFQRPLPCAADGEKWVEMTRIFSLDDA